MNVTKCDSCHEEKQLYLFKNIVDTGFSALCWGCAVKYGRFSGTSKIDMIRDEIEYNQEQLADIRVKRTKLLELLFEEMYGLCKKCGKKLNQKNLCGFHNKPICQACNACEVCLEAKHYEEVLG